MTGLGGPERGRVVVVLGHRDPHVRGHRISPETVRRVHRAEAAAAGDDVRAVVFSGFTSAPSDPSEALQMRRLWRGPAVPLVLDEAARTTAENAANSLDILLRTMPGVRHVTVVTSAWHLRTPIFFRHYRCHGIEVEMAWAPARPAEWLRHLAHEIDTLRIVGRERRDAYLRVGHRIACRRRGLASDLLA
jgi:hypothetical protein